MSKITSGSNSPTRSGSGTGSGCAGCLGYLVLFTFIGSIFFGGGVLMRVGQWNFQLGKPVDTDKTIDNYLLDLESKAKIADAAAQRFNTQLNRGKCDEIYTQASDVFKSKIERTNLVNLCMSINSQLGSIESSQRADWWGNIAEQGGSYILTRYELKLSKSTAVQSFTWLVKNGKAELVNFQLNPA